ncbi:hypothetical protein B0T10DRAFT_46328 [Thelonectria olida]|uniref:DUF7580 domain-containing protein n=1 Tax=Thelonectria olida TaxID=1576542 RepID=A0A9P9AHN4_9HYPO|nr:hypothetical protein B0T10DRAFT_46328 [Thelonectria olida]
MDTVRLHATFRLILVALEVVKKCLTDQALTSSISGMQHQTALVNVRLATDVLGKTLKEFQRLVDLEVIAEHICRLAQALDNRLAGKEEGDRCRNQKLSFDHPTLSAIVDTGICDQTGGFSSILKSSERCSSLGKVMTSVYDDLVKIWPKDGDEEDTRHETSAPYDGMFYDIAHRLFGAISCRCDPKLPQEMRLRLGTFRTKALKINDRTLDILFLCCDQGENFWHSIRIHTSTICHDLPEKDSQEGITCRKTPGLKVVSFEEPDTEKDSWRGDDPVPLECFCKCVDQLDSFWKTYTRHLEVDDQSQLQEHTCLEDSDDFPNEEFTLPDLLLAISRTETGKVVLGMQLAHALSCLYGGEWLIGRWQQQNLSLFKHGAHVPCKPWLRVSLPPQPGPRSLRQPRYHRFPQILELGIILLELQMGETLESSLGKRSTEDIDQRWAMASKKFKTMEHHILSDDYRRALAFCLKPTFGEMLPSEAVKHPELVRQSIHDNVVVRLERAIAKSRTNQEIFEGLDLGETIRSPSPADRRQLLPQESTRPTPIRDTHQPGSVAPTLQEVQPGEDNTVEEIEEEFELFGIDSEPEPNKEQVLHFVLHLESPTLSVT